MEYNLKQMKKALLSKFTKEQLKTMTIEQALIELKKISVENELNMKKRQMEQLQLRLDNLKNGIDPDEINKVSTYSEYEDPEA